jgi:hypothetical protein
MVNGTTTSVTETSALVNGQLEKLVTLVNGTSALINGQLDKLVPWLIGLVPWLMSN